MSDGGVLDERTDEKPKSQYFSKRDLKFLIVFVIVFILIASPVYLALKGQAQKATCTKNVLQIFKGMELYLADNNDHYPPAYSTADDGKPLIEKGITLSWAHLVRGNMKQDPDVSLKCPTAGDDEAAKCFWENDPKGQLVSYGYFAPIATVDRSMIDDPNTQIIVAETSNLGTNDTFDPCRLTDTSGRPVDDAYLIGFNDSNDLPTKDSKFVTRLAFPNTASGVFSKNGPSRHGDFLHALTASGTCKRLKPSDATVRWSNGRPRGYWAIPGTLSVKPKGAGCGTP